MARRRNYVEDTYSDFAPDGNKATNSVKTSMQFRTLAELALNRFKWVGLPTTIDSRALEMMLFWRGLAVWTWSERFARHLVLEATPSGTINPYHNPTHYTVTGVGYHSEKLSAGTVTRELDKPVERLTESGIEIVTHEVIPPQCVPIYANMLRTPESDIVRVYASRLAQIDRTLDMNVKTLKHPIVFATNPDTRLTMENLYQQMESDAPALFVSGNVVDSLNEQILPLDLGVRPDSLMDLSMYRARIRMEVLTLLGIDNSNQDKRERMVTDEVNANDSEILTNREAAFKMRRTAAEQINSLYGLSVSVEWCTNKDPMEGGVNE